METEWDRSPFHGVNPLRAHHCILTLTLWYDICFSPCSSPYLHVQFRIQLIL
jgi:hypothetical protein